MAEATEHRADLPTLAHLTIRSAAFALACAALAWAALGGAGLSAAIEKWQTLIGAALAVIAGLLAYGAARRQAIIAQRQFEDTIRERKRDLARRAYSDVKLLAALLAQVETDLNRAQEMVDKVLRDQRSSITTSAQRQDCMRPVDLSLAWSSLPSLMTEGVGNFLNLSSEISDFRRAAELTFQDTIAFIQSMQAISEHLNMEIKAASDRTFRVLQDTETND